MATLDQATTIAVCSVSGFIGVVIIAAVFSYCYRRHEIEVRQRQKAAAIQAAKQSRHLNGNFVQSYSRSPTRSPRTPRPVRSPPVQHVRPFYTRTNQVYNTTTSVPGAAYRHVSPRQQSNMSSKGFYVHSLGENHIFHQVPVRSLVPQSAAYQPRPAVRHAIPDFYYDKRRPGTEPPLRLGAYRPKVITEYFSPHNVRGAFTESPSNKPPARPPSAVYEKEGYSGYKDRGQSWYSQQTDVMVGTLDIGDEDESKGSTSSPNDTPSHTKLSTVEQTEVTNHTEVMTNHTEVTTKPQTIFTQNIEDINKTYKAEEYDYVIVDYLSETIKSNKSSRVTGPLGTSTPRYVEQTLQIPRRDSDSGVESLETNKRQRHPHEGSLENLPAR